MPINRDRARGALLGLTVGDAYGVRNEFQRLSAPPFPTLATGPVIDPVGGGPFRLAPGVTTDDTAMACCLAASLKAQGTFDAKDVAERHRAWMMTAAFDVGSQTRAALTALPSVGTSEEAGLMISRRSGVWAAG